MIHDGEPVKNDVDKANIFNHYFYFVFTKEDLDCLQGSLGHHSSVISSVDFSPSIVYDTLLTLDVSKTCGPDLILAYLLRK